MKKCVCKKLVGAWVQERSRNGSKVVKSRWLQRWLKVKQKEMADHVSSGYHCVANDHAVFC